jgi:hypothetical protein
MSSPLRKASMSGSSAISSRATSGRRPQIAKLGVVDDVRRAYRTGSSIAALARAHRVSRGAIRTAVADLLPGRPERPVASTANAVVAEPAMVRVETPRRDRPSPARPQRPGRGRTARPAARTYGAPRAGLQAARHRRAARAPRVAGRRRTAGRRRRSLSGPLGIPHLCRPTHRRGDSDRPGAVTSSPVGGMTALLACSRALRGAPE